MYIYYIYLVSVVLIVIKTNDQNNSSYKSNLECSNVCHMASFHPEEAPSENWGSKLVYYPRKI